ncbi:MAG: glycogen/starch/alpha-glucan phosphorylase [Clostridia bacterium]|nr:glycogen/starch/alpha-glucan phosphorylase [Clostridia bacterium]
MKYALTKKQAQELITKNLSLYFGVTPEDATYEQFYKAVAMITREMMRDGRREFEAVADNANAKRVYYLSMEFLMGRSLKNTLYNLNLTKTFTSALKDFGIVIDKLYDCEPDAGLGNGGLGRLAACYLDGLATQGYPAMGYSILYEFGIFKQLIVDGWQNELPDNWLPGGEVWLVQRDSSSVNVNFGGDVIDSWDNQYHHVEIVNSTKIKAVPYDMYVAGKDGKGISILRLWSAKAPGINMKEFNNGNYLQAVEENAMAEVISKVLYPEDKHPEGKSLRLKQQYFFVSASVQDIIRRHLRKFGSLDNLPEKVAVHINDTHPTLAIPEIMRILLDECGYGWDDAWNIVTKTVAYTNHTVMKEALECWPVGLFRMLLPRIYQIVKEIDNRYRSFIWNSTGDANKVEEMAVVSGDEAVIRMANLCVAASHSVNGVSSLHSQILKDTVFNSFYNITPDKFKNVTNGIAHRRWLCQSNPRLCSLLDDLIGNGYVYNGEELEKLRKYSDDSAVLEELSKIKTQNKADFAKLIKQTNGIIVDPNSVFDVQVKRLHEYKRQHLNAFNILARYLAIKANPDANWVPRTYIFGAKAAPGYDMAKKIINFIHALADMINNDASIKGLLKVVYMQEYNVTMAERLMPAADISEQISLCGTEASGTGNMKLMINGAITMGTLDGANVEINQAVGDENMFLFGMRTEEVRKLQREGYVPMNYYQNNAELHAVIDYILGGINGKKFPEIAATILHHDPYMVLADFADYSKAQKLSDAVWQDKEKWNKMSLENIAGAGVFAADRAINEYAKNIWNAHSAF